MSHADVESRDAFFKQSQAGRGPTGTRQHTLRTEFQPTLTVEGHTAVRTVRARLRRNDGLGEIWMFQRFVYVRGDDGEWRMMSGQGTPLYDGPAIDTALYARYAGTCEADPEYRSPTRGPLRIVWDGAALLSTLPGGAHIFVFLRSPIEEMYEYPLNSEIRFELGPDGRPVAASIERNGKRTWYGHRTPG